MSNLNPYKQYDNGLTTPGLADSMNLLPVYLQRYDRPQTQRAYRNDLVQFFGTDHITLDLATRVTFVHVNNYIAGLQSDNLKASTLKRRIAAIRGFFDWLVALDTITHNPANRQLLRRVEAVRQRDTAVTFLSSEQAEHLIDAAQSSGKSAFRDRALIITLLYCVLRRSEAAAMDVEHIRQLGHYWVLDLPHTKGGADQYVKIPAHVVEDIDAMREHFGITSGPLWRSMSNNSKHKRLSAHSIYCIVKKTAQRAGLSDDIGAHTLRHTGCTLALEAGASLQQVQTHARHKNIETTMIYIHQRDKLRDSAADYIHVRKPQNPPAGE